MLQWIAAYPVFRRLIKVVRHRFGVLLNSRHLDERSLKDQCVLPEDTLTSEEETDLDCRELAVEMRNLPDLPKKSRTAWELLIFLSKKRALRVVSKSVDSAENCLFSPSDSGACREIFEAQADENVPEVLYGSRSPGWTGNNQHQP